MSFKQTGSPEYQYTSQPDGAEISSRMIGLFAISTMGVLFGIKTHNVQYKYLSYSRWLVLLLYLCSWAFTVSTLILVATNNGEKKKKINPACVSILLPTPPLNSSHLFSFQGTTFLVSCQNWHVMCFIRVQRS